MTSELKVRLRGPAGTSTLTLPAGATIETFTVGELKAVIREKLSLSNAGLMTLRIDLSRKTTELRDDAATLQSVSCSPAGQLFVVDVPKTSAASAAAAVTITDAATNSSSSSAGGKRKAPPKPKGPPREKKPRAVISGTFDEEDRDEEEVEEDGAGPDREAGFDASSLAEALLGAEATTKETFGEAALGMALAAARLHALSLPAKANLSVEPDPRRPDTAVASFTHNSRPYQERFRVLSEAQVGAAVRAVLQRTSTKRRVNTAGTRAIFSVESLVSRGMGPPILFSLWLQLGAAVGLGALAAKLGGVVSAALESP